MSGAPVLAHRLTRREQIERFFSDNPGRRFSSADLHGRFGSAFRTRVSEINRSADSAIIIRNETTFTDGAEQSVYWAERRQRVGDGPLQVPMFASPVRYADPKEVA